QLVQTLLIVEDRALAAKNLDGDAALPAPGGAAYRDVAGRAILEPQHDGGYVEHLDFALARGRPARRIRLGHVAHHAADAAEQRVEKGQRVHAEIVERAPAVDRLVALLERRLWIGEEILVHLDADMIDRADHALVEQFSD